VDGHRIARISTCCEYRYTPGFWINGKSAGLRLVSVVNGTPCIKCQVDAFVREQQLRQSEATQQSQRELELTKELRDTRQSKAEAASPHMDPKPATPSPDIAQTPNAPAAANNDVVSKEPPVDAPAPHHDAESHAASKETPAPKPPAVAQPAHNHTEEKQAVSTADDPEPTAPAQSSVASDEPAADGEAQNYEDDYFDDDEFEQEDSQEPEQPKETTPSEVPHPEQPQLKESPAEPSGVLSGLTSSFALSAEDLSASSDASSPVSRSESPQPKPESPAPVEEPKPVVIPVGNIFRFRDHAYHMAAIRPTPSRPAARRPASDESVQCHPTPTSCD
jgi:hypothetical protein